MMTLRRDMNHYVETSMTFAEYTRLVDDLLTEGKMTGPNQSAVMFNYGKLNRQRMARLEKTVELSGEVKTAAGKIEKPQIWLVITEGWCGDAAQNIPVIEKIAAESDSIETRFILRDDHFLFSFVSS